MTIDLVRRIVVAAGILSLAIPSAARSENGVSVDLPMPTRKVRSGLNVNFDTRWVDTNGYRQIRFTLRPTAPPTATREIKIRLAVAENYMRQMKTVVNDSVEIPAGSTIVEKYLYIPQRMEFNFMQLDFYEGGYRLSDLEFEGGNTMGVTGWTETAPGVLFIDSDTPLRANRDLIVNGRTATATTATDDLKLPDVRNLLEQLVNPINPMTGAVAPTPAASSVTSDFNTLTYLKSNSRSHMLPFEELPSELLGFTCFDLIVISFDDAQKLAKEHPEKWNSLLAWIRTGTFLFVYGLEHDEARRAKLERLLKLPDAESAWETADRQNCRPTNLIRDQVQSLVSSRYGVATAATSTATPIESETAAPEVADFVFRELGLGKVFAIQGPEPFASSWQTTWMLNTIGRDQQWFERTGISLSRRNDDFWNWLIRGVGRPPVVLFLVLISLFMVGVGPVNYWLLRARGKLYLLLFTVPASAACVTLSLIAFSVIRDGLGVQWRCRSVTALDQVQGTAVAWARHSYFAGLAPAGGLKFSRDTAAYPLMSEPPAQYDRSGPLFRVDWDENQRLQGGYLPSRVTTQLMTVRSGACSARLEIRDALASGDSPQVANELDSPLVAFVICDAHGILWMPDLDEDQMITASGELLQATSQTAQRYIERWISSRLPMTELAVDSRFNRNQWWGNAIDGGLSTPPRLSTGILERTIANYSSTGVTALHRRSYVAIVKQSPFVVPGCECVQSPDGLHVIIGKY